MPRDYHWETKQDHPLPTLYAGTEAVEVLGRCVDISLRHVRPFLCAGTSTAPGVGGPGVIFICEAGRGICKV